jgi:2-polyprenyl-3-methyl-5-hydroxy-6-metoxy-1,4-benzoquinol methylase
MNNIFEFYNKISNSNNDIKTLGWGSKESQQIRFNQFLNIINETDTILDIGCGHGDLSTYCNNYTGIDIREDAISIAKSKYPNKKFITTDINKINQNYDWIFASGIFCHKLDNTYLYIEENLKLIYSKCNIGICVNFLSEYTQNKNNEMFYSDVSVILKIIEKITKKFIIKTDYLSNDFTTILYRK